MKVLKRIKKTFLKILGDIKVFRFPMFVIYDPKTFAIKGYHTRQAMDALEAGDIVLRGYNCYLDGYFIPGTFSHSGIYVGEGKIIHAIAEGVQEIDVIDFLRCDRFCIIRPKNSEYAKIAVERAKHFIGTPYDFEFEEGEENFYCHELSRACYDSIDIKKSETKIMNVTVEPRYTCDSFLDNENLEKILEIIPKTKSYYIRSE